MSTNGNRDQHSDAPTFQIDDKGNYGQDQYGNNVFAADSTETGVTEGITSQGWLKVNKGAGPLISVAIGAGGTLYANTDTFAITASSGANAEGTITTDGSGIINAVALTVNGGFFESTAPTVVISTSTGSGATLTATAGGRAGRVSYETLSTARISGDSTGFESANTANTTGTADDSILPDA